MEELVKSTESASNISDVNFKAIGRINNQMNVPHFRVDQIYSKVNAQNQDIPIINIEAIAAAIDLSKSIGMMIMASFKKRFLSIALETV